MNAFIGMSEMKRCLLIILLVATFYFNIEAAQNQGTTSDGTNHVETRKASHEHVSPSERSGEDFISKFLQYYIEDLHDFSDMIFAKAVRGEAYKAPEVSKKFELVYNQQGYDAGLEDYRAQNPVLYPKEGTTTKGNVVKFGQSLSLAQGVPIGYNIYLPLNTEIKAVFVHVYGGFKASMRAQRMDHPPIRSNLENYLLSQGIAVVKLNLVDLLQLEVHQMDMPEALHTRLHASINKFFETLKNNPTNLHEDLKVLKGKKIFLYGGSFGGRTAIRQAELYPGTFSGYISHDGALSFAMLEKSNLRHKMHANTPDSIKASQWLEPMTDDPQNDQKIQKIQEPILLLHNLDDNNVNVKVTLDWRDKAKKVGKGNLIRLYTSEMGNIIGKEVVDKGHFAPDEKEAFERYAHTISTFILNDPSKLPEMSEWVGHKSTLKANENYTAASVEEKFLSLAYRHYKEGLNKLPKPSLKSPILIPPIEKIIDGQWNSYYVPLLYAVAYAESLKGLKEDSVRSVMNYLKTSGVLTSQILEKGLMIELPPLLEFMKEKNKLYPSKDITVESLAINNRIQDFYKELVVDPSHHESWLGFEQSQAIHVLSTLYRGNLDKLGAGLIDSKDYQNLLKKWQPHLNDLKAELIQKIEKEKGHIRGVWKQARTAAVGLRKDGG